MVQHKPTPEEQLLKLIENPGTEPAATPASSKEAPAAAPKPRPEKKNPFDFGKLLGTFSYFKKEASQKAVATVSRRFSFQLDIKLINRILLALVISSVIYLMIDFFLLKPAKGNFLSQVATSEKVYPVFQNSKSLSARDFSEYEKAIQRRNPFVPPGQPAAPTKAGEVPAAAPMSANVPVINQMMSSLKLVGISWGNEPLAMIEDSENTRTYFVKKNGEVKGMKVQEISKEKVTLTYEGQEAELF